MDTFLYISMALGLFGMGVSVGAIVENRRGTLNHLLRRMDSLESTTQEMFISFTKIPYVEAEPIPATYGTLVDYEYEDPEITQDLPVIKTNDE